MQPMLPASDSNSQTTMPAPRLGPIPLMVTHLMNPHLTQEMRDTLASDAFLELPAPAQNAMILAYAQAVDLAAAAATDRHSLKCKDDLREKLEKATLDALSAAHMEAHFRELYRECWDELQPLKKARLKLLERAARAEAKVELLEKLVAPPPSPAGAPAVAEAASPKRQASEPPDGAGSPTYARLLATIM